MKRLLILFLAIVGLAIGLISCQKGSSSSPSIIGTWELVLSTDPVHFPAENVTWSFGTSTMTISYNGMYESRSYRMDGSVLIIVDGKNEIYITIVELTSSTLILSVDGSTLRFQKILK